MPPCPLRYELRTEERFEGERGGPTRVLSLFDFSLVPKGERLELTTGATYWLKKGKFLPYAHRTQALAPIALAIAPDGRTVREAQGPSQIFRALGTQGGFANLFPPLPGRSPGAPARWRLERPERTVNYKGIHVANDPRPNWDAGEVAPLDLDVRVASMAPAAGGAPALLLTSAGKDRYASPGPPPVVGEFMTKLSALDVPPAFGTSFTDPDPGPRPGVVQYTLIARSQGRGRPARCCRSGRSPGPCSAAARACRRRSPYPAGASSAVTPSGRARG